MLDGPEFERWRREADRALESATVQADAGLHNWSCFAAEQAARLAMKALLHGVGDGPWGYDLVELGRRAAESTADLWDEELEAELLRLSRHYIPARYRTPTPVRRRVSIMVQRTRSRRSPTRAVSSPGSTRHGKH